MNEAQLDTGEVARQLTELQRRLLQALKDRGPGLLLEVAVRVLKFPEDVQTPLRELQALGLVGTQPVAGGQFGVELFTLTAGGERVLRLLNDPLFRREPAAVRGAAPLDARDRQIDLLNKLGDVAKEQGELDKATDFYQQALTLTREPPAGGQ